MEIPDIFEPGRLLVVIVGGLLMLALFGAIDRAARVLLSGRRRRELYDRVAPVAGTALVLCYVIVVVAYLFGSSGRLPPLVGAVLLAALSWVSWPLLRDVLAGVAVKAGRVCRPGDTVESSAFSGRVTAMGLRVLTLETRDGDEALVPYGELASATIRRRPVLEGVSLHAFEVTTAPELPPTEVAQTLKAAAMCCHWSNVSREPEVTRAAPGRYLVTVFSLDEHHAPEIESAVRAAVATTGPT